MRYRHALSSLGVLATRCLAGRALRAIYLAVTIFLAFTSYTLLIALGSPFTHGEAPNIQAAGYIDIGVLGDSPLGSGLPARYAREISSIPGIKSVHYGSFMPVQCRAGVTAPLNGQAAINALTESRIPLSASELQAWHRERNAVLVGDVLAKRCHWHKSALLTLKGTMGAKPTFKVRIAAVYHATSKNPMLDQVADAHFQFLDDLKPIKDQGSVMWMSAKAANPSQAAGLAATIDMHFADRSPPTESNANTASQGALAPFGNVLKIVEFVMAAIFACPLLVMANVPAHDVAERRAQFALLRVLGFSRLWLTLLAVAELLYVAILGCGLGLALGLALLHWLIAPLLGSVFSGFFAVPSSVLYLAPALAAGIVLISALIPTWEIFRLHTARLSAP